MIRAIYTKGRDYINAQCDRLTKRQRQWLLVIMCVLYAIGCIYVFLDAYIEIMKK